MFNLGAFGKFLTIISLADKAVHIVSSWVGASNEERKQEAVGIVNSGLAVLVAKGKIPAAAIEGIEAEIDGAIELAHALRKHGPEIRISAPGGTVPFPPPAPTLTIPPDSSNGYF